MRGNRGSGRDGAESERWIGERRPCRAHGLSLLSSVVVTMKLSSVVLLEGFGERIQELEHLGGGLIAQAERQAHQRQIVRLHGLSASCALLWIAISLCLRCVPQ